MVVLSGGPESKAPRNAARSIIIPCFFVWERPADLVVSHRSPGPIGVRVRAGAAMRVAVDMSFA